MGRTEVEEVEWEAEKEVEVEREEDVVSWSF